MRSTPYLSALGAILYLALMTRPDIAYAVGYLGRFSANPGPKHWAALKHLLRYLKGTADYKLTYKGDGATVRFDTYCDSSHGDCIDTGRSTGAYVAAATRKQWITEASRSGAHYRMVKYTDGCTFETQGPPSGKLNVARRPSEVKGWIGSKKKELIPDIAIPDYRERWKGWWQMLQPDWQRDDSGSTRGRVVPDTGDWGALRKGGTSGLYTVVVSLAWWVGRVSDPNNALWDVVGDVEWVLIELGKLPPAITKAKGKRRLADAGDSVILDGPRKRSKSAKALMVSGA
ncbi:hypothetical protein NMY22_g20234 [Coprinellus aureogranulatus]|nr:hypothetical protein NMY22_g20234 [Coprinellus aureogranulatus]